MKDRTGILCIDKPRGPSSHQVAAWVRDLLGTPVGHSGTLDPMVSGVLVVMLGRAVRLAPLLLQSEKEYICLMRLHGEVSPEQLEGVRSEFTGRVYQRPPRRSAVKRNLRIRTISEIEILDVKGPQVLMRVRCDAGTYIRSLCHHMGFALGVGAHLQELRRTRSGGFGEDRCHTLQELKVATEQEREGNGTLDHLILPMSAAIEDLPRIHVRDRAVDAVCHGASLARIGVKDWGEFQRGATVALLTQKEELVGLGTAIVDSSVLPVMKSGLVIRPRVVVMERGTYPRGWKKNAVSKG
jgi:predicted rRNA pseudouridine synthase